MLHQSMVVQSIEYNFSGAPLSAIAASRTIRAASAEHFCALGWKAKKQLDFLFFYGN